MFNQQKKNFTRWTGPAPDTTSHFNAFEVENDTTQPLPTRRPKWRLTLAVLIALGCIVQVIFFNLSGLAVQRHSPRSKDTITNGKFALLTFEAPYREINASGAFSWTYRWYLQGGCAAPTHYIGDQFGIYCVIRKPGKPFDLAALFAHVDSWNANNGTRTVPPSQTTINIQLNPKQTVTPFGMYMAGIIITIVAVWSMSGRNKSRMRAAILMSVTALLYLIASAWLTTQARSAVHELNANPMSSALIQNAQIGSKFMALAWTARERELEIRTREEEEAARRRAEDSS
jgi:hypothetical protein